MRRRYSTPFGITAVGTRCRNRTRRAGPVRDGEGRRQPAGQGRGGRAAVEAVEQRLAVAALRPVSTCGGMPDSRARRNRITGSPSRSPLGTVERRLVAMMQALRPDCFEGRVPTGSPSFRSASACGLVCSGASFFAACAPPAESFWVMGNSRATGGGAVSCPDRSCRVVGRLVAQW